jgi:amino acid adenylation domain-containing protein/non-ribosomal peptide synthase protein (TIGR01720 family)
MSDEYTDLVNLTPQRRRLLDLWLRQEAAAAATSAAIPRRTRDDCLPLSFAQQQLWILDQLDPGNAAYTMDSAVRLSGWLKVGALERTLNEIIRRHEVLRTHFESLKGRPVQVVTPAAFIHLPLIDLSALIDTERQSLLQQLRDAETLRPFDLEDGPLLRATLLRLDPTHHVLLFTMHHIISDAWSMGLLVREVATLYTAFLTSEASPLPELPIQYADYAVWQREWFSREVLDEQLQYWRAQLVDAPAELALPVDRRRPALATHRGARFDLKLSEALTAALRELSQRAGVTLFMTLLAGWAQLLGRHAAVAEVMVGTPIAGRTRAEVEELIGFFVNTLVMRVRWQWQWTVEELLKAVREVCLGAYSHQEMPFEKLVEELQPERSLSRTPLFQVAFVLQNAPMETLELPGLELGQMPARRDKALFDLNLTLQETDRGLGGYLIYDAELFDETTIERMLEHWQILLQGMAGGAGRVVAALPMMSEAELQQLLVNWNETQSAYPRDACIHQLFELQVAATPDAIALVFEDQQVTYTELNRRANQLAHHLQSLGVGLEVPVGISLERSVEMVVGMLAILKAGGVYVPLDASYPIARLLWMLEDAGVSVLLTDEQLLDLLPVSALITVCLDTEWELVAQHSQENPVSRTRADSLAYLIYTSGSTGEPKGAAVSHRAINRLVVNTDYVRLNSSDVVAQVSNSSFDAITFELWGALLNGARLVILNKDLALSPHELSAQLVRHRITTMFLTTALFNQMARAIPTAFNGMRQLLTGGERVEPKCMEEVLRQGGLERLLHVYGPTETTTFASWYEVKKIVPDAVTIPIGRPIANTEFFVLDTKMRPVAVGVPGELYIGGDGVARGYWQRAELTAERFVPNQWSHEGGQRLYRTGDQVRYLADGNIEFLGRLDHQVKLRGFRIELGEIEAALLSHSSLREAAVVMREDALNDKRIVAYVVCEGETRIPPDKLRSFLREKLPEYMLPSSFEYLEELPLTPNGKVDRRSLPIPDQTRPEVGEYIAPRTPTEEILVSLWSRLFGVKRIGVSDNFFELGGHSLLATQMISWVRESFMVEIPLATLFEQPTIASFATRVESALKTGPELIAPRLEPAPRTQVLPLSFAQQRLWFIEQLQPGTPLYNIYIPLRLTGQLNISALANTLTEVVRRHEALRTTFPLENGQPVQVVHPAEPLKLPLIDLRALSISESFAERLVHEEAARPFDLEQGPLLRATLLRLGAGEHVLLFTMHHIISDAWSMGLLVSEVAALYGAFLKGEASPLPELAIQYADYAVWQREWLQGEVLEQQVGYWREQLAGAPAELALPSDKRRPAVQSYRGATERIVLEESLSEALKQVSQAEGVTLFMSLLAGWSLLLGRYAGVEEVMVGTFIAGRTRAEVEQLIGFFVNTLVLRVRWESKWTVGELLREVREISLGGYSHQEMPFEKLVEKMQPERSLSRTPLFQVMLVLQNAPFGRLELPGLEVEAVESAGTTAKFDLTLTLSEEERVIAGSLNYNTEIFEGETIRRMLRHLETVLRAMTADPTSRLNDLPLLSEAERHQLLCEWNQTTTPYPRQCLHQLFEAQVERTPDAVALAFEAERLTYRELNGRANQLAHYLRELGVGAELVVGLMLERSVEMVVSLLGVLKAGAAYLPLDPGYPEARLSYMLADAGVRVLLTEQRLLERMGEPGCQVVCVEQEWAAIAKRSAANVVSGVSAANLAYVIYTSGSTGQPKGVMTTHGAISNHMQWLQQSYPLQGEDVVLQKTAFGFDASVWEFYAPLLAGARLVIARTGGHQDAQYVVELLLQQQVSIVQGVPSWLRLLVDEPGLEACVGLRRVFSGGERLTVELAGQLWQRLPEVELINLYGPTEATINATYWRCETEAGEVPIGRPLANLQCFILDQQQKLVPIGVAGELLIGGVGLARGYMGAADRTAEKFIPHPFSQEPGARLYRTGDEARYRADGAIEYLGRKDKQVKLRGYRIELEEIEMKLRQHASVKDVVVLVREEAGAHARLVGYIVPAPGLEVSVSELRQHLNGTLPDYMIPAAFVLLDALPLMPNGKLDHKALPAPDASGAVAKSNFAAPQSHVEQMFARIWAEALGLEQVGIHDNFFELGGDSILAIQIVSRTSKAGLHLTTRQLFQHQTIAELAPLAVAANTAPSAAYATQTLVSGPVVLTPIQESFLSQPLAMRHHWNQSLFLESKRSLEVGRLRQVMAQVQIHHDALRLRFQQEQGGGWQQRNEGAEACEEVPLLVVDLGGMDSEAEQSAVMEAVANQAQRSLNLGAGPVWRVVLFECGAGRRQALLLLAHHLVMDAVSWRILLGDVERGYEQAEKGAAEISFGEKTMSYQQWAEKLKEYARSDEIVQQVGYWRRCLERAAAAGALPVEAVEDGEEARAEALDRQNLVRDERTVSVELGEEETRALQREVGEAYRAQLEEVLLCAVLEACRRWSGERVQVVEMEGHGREEISQEADVTRTVGWFTTQYPVVVELSESGEVNESLKRVKEAMREIPMRGIGYGLLRYLGENAAVREELKRGEVWQMSFNYLGQLDQVLSADGLYQTTTQSRGATRHPHDPRFRLLEVDGYISGGKLRMNWVSSRWRHKTETLRRLGQEFVAVLRELIESSRSSDVASLTPSDFPLAKISQQQLDRIAKLGARKAVRSR